MIVKRSRERSKRPRVVLLLSSAGTAYGGSESYLINTARYLSREISLGLIVGNGSFTRDFTALISSCPIKWISFPFICRSSLLSSMLKQTRLHEKINQFDLEALGALFSLRKIHEFLAGANILEVNYPTESLIFPYLRTNIKKLIHFHGPWLPPLYAHLRRSIDRHTDGYVTCSNWSKTELEKRLGTSDIRVIHNGVDITVFQPREPDISWMDVPCDSGLFRVGTVARLSRGKGIDVLFQAARELSGIAEFFVAGPVEKDFEDELRRYGSHPHFHVLGPVPNHNMPDFYNFLDCFVLPSRVEPFGIVLLEAMACGKPVIASRVGGIPEIVENGVNGILVPHADASALHEALQTMMQDIVLRTALARAARDRVLRHFTLEKQADESKAFYENFINGTGKD